MKIEWKKVWFISGEELIVTDAVQRLLKMHGPPQAFRIYVSGSDKWKLKAQILQEPVSHSWVMIRDIDQIDYWDEVVSWVDASSHNLVFVFTGSALYEEKTEGRRQKRRLRPFDVKNTSMYRYVDCLQMSPERQVDFLQAVTSLSLDEAGQVVRSLGAHVADVLNVARIHMYTGVIPQGLSRSIELSADDLIEDREVDLSSVVCHDFLRLIDRIEYKLSQLLRVFLLPKHALSVRDVQVRTNVSAYVVPKLLELVKRVTLRQVLLRLQLCVKVSKLYKQGVREGLIPYLYYQWHTC